MHGISYDYLTGRTRLDACGNRKCTTCYTAAQIAEWERQRRAVSANMTVGGLEDLKAAHEKQIEKLQAENDRLIAAGRPPKTYPSINYAFGSTPIEARDFGMTDVQYTLTRAQMEALFGKRAPSSFDRIDIAKPREVVKEVVKEIPVDLHPSCGYTVNGKRVMCGMVNGKHSYVIEYADMPKTLELNNDAKLEANQKTIADLEAKVKALQLASKSVVERDIPSNEYFIDNVPLNYTGTGNGVRYHLTAQQLQRLGLRSRVPFGAPFFSQIRDTIEVDRTTYEKDQAELRQLRSLKVSAAAPKVTCVQSNSAEFPEAKLAHHPKSGIANLIMQVFGSEYEYVVTRRTMAKLEAAVDRSKEIADLQANLKAVKETSEARGALILSGVEFITDIKTRVTAWLDDEEGDDAEQLNKVIDLLEDLEDEIAQVLITNDIASPAKAKLAEIAAVAQSYLLEQQNDDAAEGRKEAMKKLVQIRDIAEKASK